MVKLSNLSDTNMWKIMKKIKTETSIYQACTKEGLYEYDNILNQMVEVGIRLKMVMSVDRLENMEPDELKKAAEMFLYINACPDPFFEQNTFMAFLKFYPDLFAKKSPDLILLTLNRIKKTSNSQYAKDLKKLLICFVKNMKNLRSQKVRIFNWGDPTMA